MNIRHSHKNFSLVRFENFTQKFYLELEKAEKIVWRHQQFFISTLKSINQLNHTITKKGTSLKKN